MSVKKYIPDFVVPQYYESNYYVRTGTTIILMPDEDNSKTYTNDPENSNIWSHHFPANYHKLVDKLK